MNGELSLLHTLKAFENAVKGIAISNHHLFTVCASTAIAWYRLNDYGLDKLIDKAHERIANACCAIEKDKFATVSRDKTLRIWDMSEHSIYLSPHPNSIKCMAINSQRTAILTGSYGGTTVMFDLIKHEWNPMQRKTKSGISSIAWDDTKSCFLAASYDGQIYPVYE